MGKMAVHEILSKTYSIFLYTYLRVNPWVRFVFCKHTRVRRRQHAFHVGMHGAWDRRLCHSIVSYSGISRGNAFKF